MIRAGSMQPRFLEELQRVKEGYLGLISDQVDVWEEYDISQSLRRGATTRAQVVGVRPEDIGANNQWRVVDRANGRAPNFSSLRDHYS